MLNAELLMEELLPLQCVRTDGRAVEMASSVDLLAVSAN